MPEVFIKVLTFILRGDLQRRLANALSTTEFVVDSVASAEECIASARFARYDGVLVDSDALAARAVLLLAAQLRQEIPDTALFVFVRYFKLEECLQMFEAGADDCVREPFFASELAVRFRLSIRKRQAASSCAASNTVNLLRSGDLELDPIHRRVARSGKFIDLRPKEYLLLEYLVRHANRPVTRAMILDHLWNSSFVGSPNVVDVHISSLRTKLEAGFPRKLIQTNRGIGYTLTCASPGSAEGEDPAALGNLHNERRVYTRI